MDTTASVQHILDGHAPALGTKVNGKVDARRREDHTQQHSGQHVLSQAFERVASIHTVAFHLGADSTTIDVARVGVDSDVIGAVEELANQIVLEDRPIVIHFVEPEDVDRFALRKQPNRTGRLRIIEIEDFDQSACGGTHVERTGQIGPIKVRRTERRAGVTRIEFLCGWRALRDYSMRLRSTRDVAERLSVADHEVRDAMIRSLDELDRVRTELARSRDLLFEAEADRLVAASQAVPGRDDVRVIRQVFVDRSADDLKRLALRIVSRVGIIVLLGSNGERSQLLFAQSPGLRYDMATMLRTVAPMIGARGGGTASLAQAGGPHSGSVDLALDTAVGML